MNGNETESVGFLISAFHPRSVRIFSSSKKKKLPTKSESIIRIRHQSFICYCANICQTELDLFRRSIQWAAHKKCCLIDKLEIEWIKLLFENAIRVINNRSTWTRTSNIWINSDYFKLQSISPIADFRFNEINWMEQIPLSDRSLNALEKAIK